MADKLVGKCFFAKTLFGEYLGQYGSSLIACQSDEFVLVQAEKKRELKDIEFDDQLLKEKVSKNASPENPKSKMYDIMFKEELDLPKEGIKITIGGNANPKDKNYTAVLSIALAKAVSQFSVQPWKADKISATALLVEKSNEESFVACHGVALHGAPIFIEEIVADIKKSKPIKVQKPLFIVTIKGNEPLEEKIVGELAKKNKSDKAAVDSMVNEVKKIIFDAKKELAFSGMSTLGLLLNKNHAVLKRIGIACPETDTLVKLAQVEGAFGSKITRAGNSGNVIALCENEKQQDKLVASYLARGFKATKSKVQ